MARNRNSEKTKERILDVALHLFKEKGYEKTTILEIVERLGDLTRGAFYHHFKSKEEVLHALLRRNANQEGQVKIIENPHASGLDKIKQLISDDMGGNFKDDESAMLTHLYLGLLKDPRFLAERVKELQGESARWLETLVEAGITDGSIKKQNPKVLTELILLLFNFWMIPTVYEPLDDHTYEQKLLTVKAILEAVGCPIIDEHVLKKLQEMVIRYDETEL